MTCPCSPSITPWTTLGIYQKNQPVAVGEVIFLWPNLTAGNTMEAPTSVTWTGPFTLSEVIMKLFNEKADTP